MARLQAARAAADRPHRGPRRYQKPASGACGGPGAPGLQCAANVRFKFKKKMAPNKSLLKLKLEQLLNAL